MPNKLKPYTDGVLKCSMPGETRCKVASFRVAPSVQKKIDQELSEVGLNVADLVEYITLDEKMLKNFKEKYKREMNQSQENVMITV